VIADGPSAIRDYASVEQTVALMRNGQPIISQGVLWDETTRTYGAPDLLVRSDVLHELWPTALTAEDASAAAPGLDGGAWHYRVVDIKFTTLKFLKSGLLGNSGSAPAYKAQVWIYNQALTRLQGYESPRAYLLGRSWEEGYGEKRRGRRADERVGVVDVGESIGGMALSDWATDAIEWIRRLRSDGAEWKVLPEPTVSELRPNMTNTSDAPWHSAKRQMAIATDELTVLWQVGVDKRDAAISAGVSGWRDPECTADALGVRGAKQKPVFEALLAVNRGEGPIVQPERVGVNEHEWREPDALEFYVDFETVSDLDDDFSNFPHRGGTPMITMIGCGHVADDAWAFECFSVDALEHDAEARIIDAWHEHMATVRARIAPDQDAVRVFHWSPAEVSVLETAYNSAIRRHADRIWPAVSWTDLLKLVVKAEPLIVRGAMGFGLKAIAKALHGHGLIATSWDDGPADGLGAMVGAWWCAEEAARSGVSMRELDLMQEIERYNEVDCRVMMEILSYLRLQH
jgi:hypothetical protein